MNTKSWGPKLNVTKKVGPGLQPLTANAERTLMQSYGPFPGFAMGHIFTQFF